MVTMRNTITGLPGNSTGMCGEAVECIHDLLYALSDAHRLPFSAPRVAFRVVQYYMKRLY